MPDPITFSIVSPLLTNFVVKGAIAKAAGSVAAAGIGAAGIATGGVALVVGVGIGYLWGANSAAKNGFKFSGKISDKVEWNMEIEKPPVNQIDPADFWENISNCLDSAYYKSGPELRDLKPALFKCLEPIYPQLKMENLNSMKLEFRELAK